LRELIPILKRGRDAAEKKYHGVLLVRVEGFGSELLETFIEAAFNILPTVLFERMLTIVYVAQDSVVKHAR
jgi:hypothetical protein